MRLFMLLLAAAVTLGTAAILIHRFMAGTLHPVDVVVGSCGLLFGTLLFLDWSER